MNLTLDITVHHFGSSDALRDYQVRNALVQTDAPITYWDATCQQNAAYFVGLRAYAWTAVSDDWWNTTLELQTPSGQQIGQRPALIFGKPYDIPVYTSFKDEHFGMFSVGLRTVAAG